MARQDFWGLDSLGFRWQATLRVEIPIVDLANDLLGLPDDQVLAHLRERSFPDVPGVFSAGHVIGASESDEYSHPDQIFFDAVGRDNYARPVVRARIVSTPKGYLALAEGLHRGVHDTQLAKRTRAVLRNRSRLLTTSFKVTHVHHPDVPSFPGSAIGLDSAWRIAIGGSWTGKESALRSLFAQRDHRLANPKDSLKRGDLTPEDYDLDRGSSLPDIQKPACGSDDNLIWLNGVPNTWLFDQALTCDPYGTGSGMPLAGLLRRTEIFLGLYNRRPHIFPGPELKRLQPITEMLRHRKCRPQLRDEGGRRKIIYRGTGIGELEQHTRRVRFSPTPTREWDLWSCPVEEDGNIEAVLAAMILDAAWAREILLDGRHLSSFLGPIAEDYPDTNWHENKHLLLDDGRDDRPNPYGWSKQYFLS